MPDNSDDEVGRLAAVLPCGSIVAAAGCGKTEQLARAVEFSERRRLVLTHTHAGVDAIRRRLIGRNVASDKYRVDTIAGWCLRIAAAFPKRSGIDQVTPDSSDEWNAVYAAAARLIESGALSGVLEASYGGLYVDEYQDCTREQHNVIRLLAQHLPSCVFGDPLQAIFDFRGQQPVDWNTDVFPVFPRAGELTTPWRWRNADNDDFASWLKDIRVALERGDDIDLRWRPACLTWAALPDDLRFQRGFVVKQCLGAINNANGGNLIVIGDSANMNSRAELAKKLAKRGFSNIEPISCKDLFAASRGMQNTVGMERFKAVLTFVSKCMTGTEKAAFERAVQSRLDGRSQGQAKFGDLFPITDTIIRHGTYEAMLAFLDRMQERVGTYLFRKEMFFAMRSALQIMSTLQHDSLSDAIWDVQNRIRHAGRKFGKRSIGSTLLVKGLEFDHSAIVHTANMNRKEWYVALTRATTSVRVISPAERFTPIA